MKNALTACLFLLCLASCSDGTPPAVKTDIAPTSKINLDVLTISVVDRNLPPGGDSLYAHNNFKPTIAEAVRTWVSQHLAAVGSTGEATLIIQDASLKSQNLSFTHDMFKRQQASKYIGHAELLLEITGHEGNGQVSAEASRFETLPEEPTGIEKTNAYNSILNGLIRDLNRNFDGAVNDHLADFVVTAPVLSH